MKHAKKKKSFRHESTIIYCTTQSQVEDITSWLCDQFEGSGIRVQSYHGGQGIEHRSNSHINFLTGKTSVIVATLAFGMGIDKLDTRLVCEQCLISSIIMYVKTNFLIVHEGALFITVHRKR